MRSVLEAIGRFATWERFRAGNMAPHAAGEKASRHSTFGAAKDEARPGVPARGPTKPFLADGTRRRAPPRSCTRMLTALAAGAHASPAPARRLRQSALPRPVASKAGRRRPGDDQSRPGVAATFGCHFAAAAAPLPERVPRPCRFPAVRRWSRGGSLQRRRAHGTDRASIRLARPSAPRLIRVRRDGLIAIDHQTYRRSRALCAAPSAGVPE